MSTMNPVLQQSYKASYYISTCNILSKGCTLPDIVASWIIVLFIDVDEGGLRSQSQVGRECHAEFSSSGVKRLV